MKIPLMALLTRGEFDAANRIANEVLLRRQYDMALAQDKRKAVTKRRVAIRKQEER